MKGLIQFWKSDDLNEKPFIHPNDLEIIKEHTFSFNGFRKYFESVHWNSQTLFHTDLVPVPFAGNLGTAKIYILLLNPGFSPSNYIEEQNSQFKEALMANLFQSDAISDSFPFFYLDPRFLWTSGGQYWLKKFKSYIPLLKEKNNCTELEALSTISKKVAVIELYPYHSSKFRPYNKFKSLPSRKKVYQFIKGQIVPQAKSGQSLIICTRKAKEWDLEADNNVIVYSGHEARGAHISKNSRAGQKIEGFLTKKR
jgi:hypothetical protein